jgi:hypothetical protein
LEKITRDHPKESCGGYISTGQNKLIEKTTLLSVEKITT